MKAQNVKEYPPCPYLISDRRLNSLWLAIPICICICFIRGVGVVSGILFLLAWILIIKEKTWEDWTIMCDNGMIHMEVSNKYLLKYGFVQERPGCPVRKLSPEEINVIEDHLADPNWFRYDYKWHEIDEYHGYYDEDAGFWLTKKEWKEKQEFEEANLTEYNYLNEQAYRLRKRMELEFGWLDTKYFLSRMESSEHAKDQYVRAITTPNYTGIQASVYLNAIKDNENPYPEKWSEEKFQMAKQYFWKITELLRKRDEVGRRKKWEYPRF